MEAYALLALGGIGLFAARKQFSRMEGNPPVAPAAVPGNVPSVNTVYDSSHTAKVARQERKQANAMAALSRLPVQRSGVVPRGPHLNTTSAETKVTTSKVRSQLAGIDIPVEHFTHNNMTPFYRGDIKQNMAPAAHAAVLENMTGNGGFLRESKREVPAIFPSQKNPGNMHGTPLATGTLRDRMVVPQSRNNEFPIPQVQVGPGIGKGFTAKPSDGYFDQRQYNMPRGTDEIRAANNPKLTFEGRVLPGQGAQKPGKLGKVEKNRPETTVELPPSWYQPTTGAFLKDSQRPEFNDRPQARQATTREYAGVAFSANTKATERPGVASPKTQSLAAMHAGPVAAADRGRGADDDKGKSSIQVYANARDTTTTKAYQGNVSALVKSITAPLLDIVKPNRSACPHIVYNPREDGNVKGPSRIRVYDPDDVARTTLKQGMLNDAQAINLRGPALPTVHDPDNVARTTTRQTTLQEAAAMNLRGPTRPVAHDPNNVTKTTTKQTTLQESQAMNLRGPSRTTVYDPTDVSRTTTKQTLLQEAAAMNLRGPTRPVAHDPDDVTRTTTKQTTLEESHAANIATHTMRGQVYDTEDDARTTHRETLAEEDHTGSVKPNVPNGAVWDPDDAAKTTAKQTLIDAAREAGNPDGLEGQRGAYLSTEYDARHTQKEVISDNDYYGHGARDRGEGYVTAPTDLRPAVKAVLSDNDYFGVAADQGAGAQPSHENFENASINDTRELVLEGRAPTASSVKVASGADNVGRVEVRRQLMPTDFTDSVRTGACVARVHDDTDAAFVGHVTHERQRYTDSSMRLEDDVVASHTQLNNNPFNIRIN